MGWSSFLIYGVGLWIGLFLLWGWAMGWGQVFVFVVSGSGCGMWLSGIGQLDWALGLGHEWIR